MSIDVEVGLISGRRATVQAALDESVGTLKRRAQIALGLSTGLGRLLDPSGCVLAGWAPIKKARVQHGDSLTLLTTNTVQVQACYAAFAAILADGSGVLAVLLYRISSRLCSRSEPVVLALLLPFLTMDSS